MHHLNRLSSLRPQRLLAFLFLAIALFAIGCDDDPPKYDNQWWYSNSVVEPDAIERFGVKWLPAGSSGEYRWCYYPKQVLSVITTARRLPPDTTMTISVGGNPWTLLRGDNTLKVQAPWESDFSKTWTVGAQADDDMFTGDFEELVAICICVIVLVCGIMLQVCDKLVGGERQKQKVFAEARTTALDRHEAILNDKQQKLEKWEQTAAVQAAKLDKWQKTEAANLERTRGETEEYYRRGMEMVRAAQETLKSWPGHQKINQYLRERHLQGAAFGDTIVVNFLADQTGFIRFKWQVQLQRNEPPLVVISRDEKLIRTDASFTGEHGDHMVPGHRYLYRFSVRDAKDREFGKPLVLEVKTPTKQHWDAGCKTDDDDQHARKIREKFKAMFNGRKVTEDLRKSYKAKVIAGNYPAEVRDWLLDQIDAVVDRLREEQ